MARVTWKYSYFSKSIFKKILINKLFNSNLKKFPIMSRCSSIPSSLLNSKVGIHNGMNFVFIYVTKFMIGRKFGEFSFTRKNFFFPLKEKKKKLIKR